jgi:glycosyltransferase involved in cell wall biosynthesis
VIKEQILKNAEGISVVIPVYNEEKAVGGVVDDVRNAMSKTSYNCEIVVIDDGSTDGTPEILAQRDVRVIRHQNNLGYGAALRTGLRNSQYDLIAIIDADASYPSQELPGLIDNLGSADMVVGARTGKNVSISLIRRPAKYFLGKLANYLTESKIPDLNSGMRVFRKEVVNKYMHLLPRGFSFTTTVTMAMICGGDNVKFISIDYFKRQGRSKINGVIDAYNFLLLIVRTVVYFNPLKVFLPVGMILLCAGFGTFLYDVFCIKNLSEKTLLLVIAGILVCMLGMLADLIVKVISRSSKLG